MTTSGSLLQSYSFRRHLGVAIGGDGIARQLVLLHIEYPCPLLQDALQNGIASAEDGLASVVFAVDDNPAATRTWLRLVLPEAAVKHFESGGAMERLLVIQFTGKDDSQFTATFSKDEVELSSGWDDFTRTETAVGEA